MKIELIFKYFSNTLQEILNLFLDYGLTKDACKVNIPMSTILSPESNLEMKIMNNFIFLKRQEG